MELDKFRSKMILSYTLVEKKQIYKIHLYLILFCHNLQFFISVQRLLLKYSVILRSHLLLNPLVLFVKIPYISLKHTFSAVNLNSWVWSDKTFIFIFQNMIKYYAQSHMIVHACINTFLCWKGNTKALIFDFADVKKW